MNITFCFAIGVTIITICLVSTKKSVWAIGFSMMALLLYICALYLSSSSTTTTINSDDDDNSNSENDISDNESNSSVEESSSSDEDPSINNFDENVNTDENISTPSTLYNLSSSWINKMKNLQGRRQSQIPKIDANLATRLGEKEGFGPAMGKGERCNLLMDENSSQQPTRYSYSYNNTPIDEDYVFPHTTDIVNDLPDPSKLTVEERREVKKMIRQQGLYGIKGDYNCDIMRRGAVANNGFIEPLAARREFSKYVGHDVTHHRDPFMRKI